MSEAVTLSTRAAEKNLIEHLIRREVVVFAGAGVSKEARPPLPDWKQLIESLTPDLPPLPPDDKPDALDVAQWFVNEHGRRKLEERLVAAFGREETAPSPLQEALAALPVNVFFTTNYDQLIEKALAGRRRFADAIVDDRHVGMINDLTTTTVVKLHGCVSLSDTMILARDDYETYHDTHRALVTYLQSQLATRVFLFVGFSFSDPDFRVIHNAIQRTLRSYHRRAYALKLGSIHPLVARQWKGHGIDVVEMADADGRLELALEVLKEARKWLRKGEHAPWMQQPIDDRRERQAREQRAPRAGSHMPYLLNHLGKNYRLAYELNVAWGNRKEAERCRQEAVARFVRATKEAPLLPYPRGHLISMYENNLLGHTTGDKNLRLNIEQIEALAQQSPAGKRMRDALYQRHQSAWKKSESVPATPRLLIIPTPRLSLPRTRLPVLPHHTQHRPFAMLTPAPLTCRCSQPQHPTPLLQPAFHGRTQGALAAFPKAQLPRFRQMRTSDV